MRPSTLFCRSTADFSRDRTYRYSLTRQWGDGRTVNFVMLNPSTADEYANDPTVERCQRRAVEWGFDGLIVTNLFAMRATDPRTLWVVDDPVGPRNDEALIASALDAKLIICAWGNHGSRAGRSRFVAVMLRNLGKPLHILRLARSGEPWHPLYLPYSVKPREWTRSKLEEE